jgi:transcriptional regulator with XRE-family HTH domain
MVNLKSVTVPLEISLTPRQCRAARALLSWTQAELSKASKIGQKTIADFELGTRQPFPHTLHALKEALETAGIEFVDAVEGKRGPGVILKWEAELQQRQEQQSRSESGGNGGVKALDANLAQYWQDRPELWWSLSQAGRCALSSAMYGDSYTADEMISGT